MQGFMAWWPYMPASAGGQLVVWVRTFNLTLIYFAWVTGRVRRSMQAPPTWLITPSPLCGVTAARG